MKNHKKFLCFAFPVALVMALVLGLAFMNIGAGKELANAASSIYVESGGTCTISGGTISDDIDVAGGTLTLTGGSVGNINLNGTMNLSSGATINGTVNLQNTNSYITLTSSLTKTISVKASSTAAGTRIAYSATASYLNIDRFSVTNLPSNMKLVVESNYIVIRSKGFTVTFTAGNGGSVSRSRIDGVPSGSAITVNGDKITINGTEVAAIPNEGYKFSSWAYSGTTVTGNMTITANFEITTYTVTILRDAFFGQRERETIISDVPYGTQITEDEYGDLHIGSEIAYADIVDSELFYYWIYESDVVQSDMTIVCTYSLYDEEGYSDRFGDNNYDYEVLERIMHYGGNIKVGLDVGRKMSEYEEYIFSCIQTIVDYSAAYGGDMEEAMKDFLRDRAYENPDRSVIETVEYEFTSVDDITEQLYLGDFDFYLGNAYTPGFDIEDWTDVVYEDLLGTSRHAASAYRSWMQDYAMLNNRLTTNGLIKDYLVVGACCTQSGCSSIDDEILQAVDAGDGDYGTIEILAPANDTSGSAQRLRNSLQELQRESGLRFGLRIKTFNYLDELITYQREIVLNGGHDLWFIDMEFVANEGLYTLATFGDELRDEGIPYCVLSDWLTNYNNSSNANYDYGSNYIMNPAYSYFIYTDESAWGGGLYMYNLLTFVSVFAQKKFNMPIHNEATMSIQDYEIFETIRDHGGDVYAYL